MATLIRRARPLLGTFVEIAHFPGNAEIFEAVFGRIAEVQRLMSAHTADSDLAAIAKGAHRGGVAVDPATAAVIGKALEWAEMSGGAFDPVRAGGELVAAGRRPWFGGERPVLGASWLDLEIDGNWVKSSGPLAIDLGGIAKGYAVDQAAEIIAGAGADGVVNAGGDMRFIGQAERRAFIRRPDVGGGLFELGEIPRPALATSASFIFAAESENLDLVGAAGGAAVRPHVSVTVFAASCMLADAMTKVVLNLPAKRAAAVLQRLECHALVLENGGGFHELP